MTRLERIVARRQSETIARVAAVVRAAFPDIDAEPTAAAVMLVGHGLSRRLRDDARLRGIGMMMREGGP